MTASRSRRTRMTVVSAIIGVLALVAVGGLAYAGVQNLYDSRAGRRVASSLPGAHAELPFTATALVASVDGNDRITSVAVLTLEPDGSGGSIVTFSPSGDAASGNSPVLEPLLAVYVADGPEAFLSAAEGLTSLSFDVAEVVDAERFAALVAPLGELTVDFPTELRDEPSGDSYAPGVHDLTPAQAAEALTASDPGIADWYLDPARAAIWAAVADRIGAGVGSVDPLVGGAAAAPRTLDEFVTRLFAGRVEHRRLGSNEIDPTRVSEQLDERLSDAFAILDDSVVSVVAHDRAEVLLVFGSVAPSRLAAPLEGPSFRVVAHFADETLEPLGLNNADVARQAINRLLFTKTNVVSFGQPDDVPEVTVFEVADANTLAGIEASYGGLFGESEVRVATELIEGIDVQVTLGTDFLSTIEAEGAGG